MNRGPLPVPDGPEGLSHRLSRWRRELHRIPEPAHAEYRTSRYLAGVLDQLGLTERVPVAETGWLVTLRRGRGPTVLLRADMDGLPIAEATGAPYASEQAGWMHACGHDAHMACLLGALERLADPAFQWGPGRVVALFQPAEETTPSGAAAVAASGRLEEFEVAAVLGQHIDHTLEAGAVAIRPGPMMARADEFLIRFHGPGGHASQQGERADPVAAAARLTTDLREGGAGLKQDRQSTEPLLIHIGSIQAGEASNVIPVEALVRGTARSYRFEDADRLEQLARSVAEQAARSTGCEVEIEWRPGGAAVINDERLTRLCRQGWQTLLGADRIRELDRPSLAAEDFGCLLGPDRPGVYWRLGIRGERVGAEPWHTPLFDLDESALPVGALALAGGARAVLAGLAGQP